MGVRARPRAEEGRPAGVRWLKSRLLRWWEKNRRHFPWRETSDPYRVLVAELMLRRTRAPQVVPVYTGFISEFPDAKSLALASGERIREILRPFGLEKRAGDMVLLARALRDHAGRIPEDPDLLRSLPGVGDYVASAVLCFAFGHPVPVADVNTCRVVCRFFGITTAREARRSGEVRAILQAIAASGHARESNLALMDLAASICRPGVPVCACCPLEQRCRKGGGPGRSRVPRRYSWVCCPAVRPSLPARRLRSSSQRWAMKACR